jgi:hypothetical protein
VLPKKGYHEGEQVLINSISLVDQNANAEMMQLQQLVASFFNFFKKQYKKVK